MSYSDNIESNLKSLESRGERSSVGGRSEQARREMERVRALAAAPHAEKLRTGKFTSQLLDHTARFGHALRTKVHITWLGTVLRLQARDHRLELHPTPDGVVAHFFVGDRETGHEPVKLESNPERLARRWLEPLGSLPRN